MRITSTFQSLLGVGLLALSSSQRVSAASGGSWCTNTMCVGATISEGNTFYSLNTTTSFSRLGWMAVGWGTRMTGSSIVILWPNDDGTITVSQRQATGQFQPRVDSSPARVATLQTSMSTLTGSAITLSFSMPSSGQTTESMIYAMSLRKPGSSDPAADIQQHNFQGTFQLDLTQTVADLPSPSATTSATATSNPTSAALPLPTSTSGSSNDQTLTIPYTSTEKKFIAHAVLSALGFCFFLPIGVLQARFLRIWWPKWFKAHWIIQAGLAGPCIVVGFALAVVGVNESGGTHFADKHMSIGLALFVLYAAQAAYGLVIHLVKDPNRKKRPIQNYGHAIVGLALISLSLYQVWLGFDGEWSRATGRDKPGRGLPIFWIIWVVILGAAYVVGLALLPKQYNSEALADQNREKSNEMLDSKEDVYPLNQRS